MVNFSNEICNKSSNATYFATLNLKHLENNVKNCEETEGVFIELLI